MLAVAFLLPAAVAVAGEPLSSVASIRALPVADAERGVPVEVTGVVTRATRYELFIQDGTEGIFVWQDFEHPVYRLGQFLKVIGVTSKGHFSPVIKASAVEMLGEQPLPSPLKVSYHDLAAGRQDCRWVEVEGLVRAADATPWGTMTLRVAVDGTPLTVQVAEPAGERLKHLVNGRVRLRGVAGGSKTVSGQIVEPVLWVEYRPDTFRIVQDGPADLFALPLVPVRSLLEYGSPSFAQDMSRVAGVVTWTSPLHVYIRDGEHSLEISLQRPASFAVGDHIEAVGFPEMGPVQPLLLDAIARRISAGAAPSPRSVDAARLLDVRYEGDLVQVTGTVREIFRRERGIALTLAEGDLVFGVDLEATKTTADGTAPELPPVGSRVSVAGICRIDRVTPPDNFQLVAPASFRLHARSFEDVQVIVRPPWWTPARLLSAIAVLGVFSVAAAGWIWSLDRRVRAQTRIILRNAQSEAALEERNRIAREFHDTVEQQLAAATIQLDAVADAMTQQPARAAASVDTARAMLRHSLAEAQRAVSDLRSEELVMRDLRALIEEEARGMARTASIPIEFRTEGAWPDLPPVTKHHLLRIVQESLTNALKHAAPTRIMVSMRATADELEIQVKDDGCGLHHDGSDSRRAGEFGLLGMTERAARMRGKLRIHGAPGQGTTVTVSLRRRDWAET